MSIQDFQKLQAEMPTPELIAKARAWNTKLCATGGNAWSLRVPVSEDDPDMIFGEICRRLEITTSALERIVSPIKHMRAELKQGEVLNGAQAVYLADSGKYLRGIAEEALLSAKPKTP